MKPIIILASFSVFAIPALLLPLPQNQSLTLPKYPPIHCSKQTGCAYPGGGEVGQGKLGIIVAREAAGGTITDALGNTWTLDQCTQYDYGDCIFHTNFMPNPNNYSDKLTLTGGFNDVWLFVYDGTWNFVAGTYADYAHDVAPPDCPTFGSCAYSWARPMTADAGTLLIMISHSNATGPSLASPGFGWNLEASDGQFAVEDMIAPISGVYTGSLIWKQPNGQIGGGSHWLGASGAFQKLR